MITAKSAGTPRAIIIGSIQPRNRISSTMRRGDNGQQDDRPSSAAPVH